MHASIAIAALSRYRWVMAAMSLLGHLALGFNLFGISPVLPLAIADYGISSVAAGLLVSLPMLLAAALGVPGGMLVARIGVKYSQLIAWGSMAVLTLSFLAPNFGVMLLLRLAYGVGLALMITSTGPLLMAWFSRREVLVMNSLNTAAVSLGVAIAVAGAAPLAEITNWKISMSVFGLVGVAGCLLWLALGRDAPLKGVRPAPISLRQTVNVLRGRTVILLVLTDAGVLFQYTALTGWLPTFFNDYLGLSLSEAGLITGMLPFVGVFAVLAGGLAPLRFDSPRAIFIVSGLAAVFGGLGSYLLPNLPGIYLAAGVLGFGSWFYVPILLTLPLRLPGITPQGLAVIYGSLMTFSGFAMFVAPILVGALRDATDSFLPGFLICTALSATPLLAGSLLPREAAHVGESG